MVPRMQARKYVGLCALCPGGRESSMPCAPMMAAVGSGDLRGFDLACEFLQFFVMQDEDAAAFSHL